MLTAVCVVIQIDTNKVFISNFRFVVDFILLFVNKKETAIRGVMISINGFCCLTQFNDMCSTILFFWHIRVTFSCSLSIIDLYYYVYRRLE